MDRPSMCIISFSYVFRDGRVLRQIEYASREFDVDVIGYGEWAPRWPNVRFQEVKKRVPKGRLKYLQLLVFLLGGWIFPRLWMKAYWWRIDVRDALKMLLMNGYSIIHANDLQALPVAIVAANQCGGKVLFDAHEYYVGQAKYTLVKKKLLYYGYVGYLLRKCGPRANAFVTVSQGLADVYRREFGLCAEVIMNAPAHGESRFRPVEPERIRLIHHGGATRNRQLEKLIEMIATLPNRFSLHFMLIRDRDGYVQDLKEMSEKVCPGRVFFREAVSPSRVVETLTDFDVGVYSLPPDALNNRLALPNKLFDFCAAGLAVVIGPSPEMARLVGEHRFGVVADGFEGKDLASAVKKLGSEDINKMKRNAVKASALLNADVEMAKLMEMYQRLVGGVQNEARKNALGGMSE